MTTEVKTPDNAPPAVGQMFDKSAGEYDAEIDQIFRPTRERLHQLIDPEHAKQIVDLACGPGVALEKLCERAKAPQIVCGVDLSLAMLKIAQRRVRRWPFASLLHCDLGHFVDSAPKESFDLVTMHFALAYLEADKAIPRIARIVKKGGRLGIVTSLSTAQRQARVPLAEMCDEIGMPFPDEPHVPRDEEDLRARLKIAGLEVEHLERCDVTRMNENGADLFRWIFRTGWNFHPMLEGADPDAAEAIIGMLGAKADAHFARPDGKVPMDFHVVVAVARKPN